MNLKRKIAAAALPLVATAGIMAGSAQGASASSGATVYFFKTVPNASVSAYRNICVHTYQATFAVGAGGTYSSVLCYR